MLAFSSIGFVETYEKNRLKGIGGTPQGLFRFPCDFSGGYEHEAIFTNRQEDAMEQSYAEANAKKKMTGAVIALKTILIVLVILVFVATILSGIRLLVLLGVAAVFGLIWYWPRFKVEWEYVFCDGQLDFDMIQGGERRKNILRIEIEDADVIAPVDSHRLDGYRHLDVRDYSSMKENVKVYGIATRLPEKEDKVLILFEPTSRMIDLMHKKCPDIVEMKS